MFKDCIALKVFDLSANNLTSLPENLFEFMLNVEMVNLSRNSFEMLPSFVFQRLKKLTNLDLAHNQLTEDNFLWPIMNLKFLNISFNLYREVNISVLETLDGVRIFENPLDCDWLVMEMSYSPKHIQFGRDFVTGSREIALRLPGIQCFEKDGSLNKVILLDADKKDDVEIDDVSLDIRTWENKIMIIVHFRRHSFKSTAPEC